MVKRWATIINTDNKHQASKLNLGTESVWSSYQIRANYLHGSNGLMISFVVESGSDYKAKIIIDELEMLFSLNSKIKKAITYLRDKR